jgi:DNA-binding protein YbaB
MLNNLFGSLGNLSKLKAMQDALKKQEMTFEQNGVKVVVRGDLQVKDIVVDGVSQDRIVAAVNEAMKKMQAESAKSLMAMG